MSRFDPIPTLSGLRDFQRATVDYVMRRLYEDPDPTRRLLVADPVGMGKTYVARGVIARAIERLEADSSIGRIDIVYVCSNTDIASQNIRRLDVTGGRTRAPARRLTLLATQVQDLDRRRRDGGKTINLVAFTPGTSFELAGRGGTAEERALLHLLLVDHYQLSRAERTASQRLLQGGVATLERFQHSIRTVRGQIETGVDPNIVRAFLQDVTPSKCGHQYRQLVDDVTGRRPYGAERDMAWTVIGELRNALARASIQALEPDLVILDEFQRFKYLLDRKEGGEAAELAHHLFQYPDARVLLLSATPYKMYTLAEEAGLGGEDHHQDFIHTVRFLSEGVDVSPMEIDADFANLRAALIQGIPTGEIAGRLSDRLRKVMCRTERPDLDGHGMLTEVREPAGNVRSEDLLGYVSLRRLADEVGSAMSIEHWKSAPYFLNFVDGYQLGGHLRAALSDGDGDHASLRPIIRGAQRLDRDEVRAYRPIDLGNPKLRNLGAQTLDAGWWKLLWLPSSIPYYRASGPWDDGALANGMTKRVIFSSWAAAPTGIASLLSYEAERRAAGSIGAENTPQVRRRIAGRLAFRLADGRPAAMTSLALFWPFPTLASLCDPLAFAREAPDQIPSLDEALQWATAAVQLRIGADGQSMSSGADAWYWVAPLQAERQLMSDWRQSPVSALADALRGSVESDADDTYDQAGLTAHINYALATLAGQEAPATRPVDLGSTVALLGLAAPGNVAWRALSRIMSRESTVTPLGQWRAAAVLASGFRTLFNRPDTAFVLDRLLPDEPYWRNVLQYCAWGGLQSVLDEYIHHLAEDEGFREFDDASLLALAERARAAIALRPATYRAFDPMSPSSSGIPFTSRFALRYGTLRQRDDDARLPELRSAFNSPFRPFVLATTSIGQEGIDFHWWCHAIVHWNVPPNPVDFEQREGRITRYKGHAIRRNVGAAHRRDALLSAEKDPWVAAFAAAAERRPLGANDLFPYWVYPGAATIERHVPQVPMSRDSQRYTRVRDTLTLYRLAFGQPRQEDLLALLARGGVPTPPEGFTGLIDLRPPLSDGRNE